MKRYCKVYYKTCAYTPCSRLFVVGYLRYKVKTCSNECYVEAARSRLTPAESARRSGMRLTAPTGRTEPSKVAKPCEHCGMVFRPFHGSQRWCSVCAPDRAARSRMKMYGVTEAEWVRLVGRYGGLCWICRTNRADNLDHDHATGRVRGALYTACNVHLGHVESEEWFHAARAYLALWRRPVKVAAPTNSDQLTLKLTHAEQAELDAPIRSDRPVRAELIRSWASVQGIPLKPRGRLPRAVVEAWQAQAGQSGVPSAISPLTGAGVEAYGTRARDIRLWALQQGFVFPKNGKLNRQVIEAWEEAQAS